MKKILIAMLLLAVFIAMYISNALDYLSVEKIAAHQLQIQQWVQSNLVSAIAMFFIAYTLITALALPFAALLTVLAGFLFGTLTGSVMISFASTLGACGSFLIARYLARNYLQQKFYRQWTGINRSFEKDGPYYLFFLRLVPVVPFFLINIVMGLTSIRLKTFYWVSQLAMLPGTVLYVNAGSQLAGIETVSGIFSFKIIISLLLLAIFPFVARAFLQHLQARKNYQGYTKPKRFDFNVLVIGAGSAGLVSAYTAAMLKATTALVEKDRMGGDCLNTGCVPSKALLRSAGLAQQIKNSDDYGLKAKLSPVDMELILQRVRSKIEQIAPNDSIERYTKMGVSCMQGNAVVHSPWEVEVNGSHYSCKNIIIATGARPTIPEIPGLASVDYYTTDTIWSLNELPIHLLIIGGGPIGCELGQAYARLGAKVSIIESASRILPREDQAASALVQKSIQTSGVEFYLNHAVLSVQRKGSNSSVIIQNRQLEQQTLELQYTHLLIATGREANLEGLESLHLDCKRSGQLLTNEFMQTRFPNVYACGDVVGPYQYTHAASNQAWYATVNALFSPIKKFCINDSLLPRAVFTDPEIASVGMSQKEADEEKINYEVTLLPFTENDRAVVDDATTGFIKIITADKSDRILGVTIVGEHAGELIGEFLLAMSTNIGLNKILRTIHIYPTRSEIARQSAGEWRKKHYSEFTRNWLRKFHQWRLR